MKKIMMIICLITVLLLSACDTNSYESYKAALEKTDNVVRGQKEIQMNLNMDFDFKDMSDEDLKKLRGSENISMKGYFRFDRDMDQVVSDLNVNFGGVGMDAALYVDGEELWLKVASSGKYMALHDMEYETSDMDFEISEDTFEKIGDLWESYVTDENLFVGEAVLVDTPMGDVKSTKFYVDMNKEQLKAFMSEMFVLLEEEGVIEMGEELTLDMDNVIINEMTVESFIDIDNYVIEENIVFDINFLDSDFEGIKFDMKMLLYDIEEEQELDMPEIDPSQIMTFDAFQEDAGQLFEIEWED